jgi:hypothetical protein
MTDIDRAGLGKRLRAIMAHLEIETVREFAATLGAERNAVSNWINAATSGNPPPVPAMLKLIERERDLTLDWIYTGNPARLPTGLFIRLSALMDGAKIPESNPDLAENPELPAQPPRPGRGSPLKRQQPARPAT